MERAAADMAIAAANMAISAATTEEEVAAARTRHWVLTQPQLGPIIRRDVALSRREAYFWREINNNRREVRNVQFNFDDLDESQSS